MSAQTPEEQAAGPQPQPIPTAFGIGVTDTQPPWVILQINDATGQRFVFLDPAAAESLGGQIRAAGKQAKSGLIVPQNGHGLIVPGQG